MLNIQSNNIYQKETNLINDTVDVSVALFFKLS